jgi:hypothetical protein
VYGSRIDSLYLPPGHQRIISPYDLDARYSIKRDLDRTRTSHLTRLDLTTTA